MSNTPNQPDQHPAKPKQPNEPPAINAGKSSPIAVVNPVDDPDALRPGSANDPRNINKIDPLHESAGIGDDSVSPSP